MTKITFKKKPTLQLMSIVPQSVIGKCELTPEWQSYVRNMVKRRLVTVTFEWEEAKSQ